MNRNPICKLRTNFYHDASTYERFCDRRVVENPFCNDEGMFDRFCGRRVVSVSVSSLGDENVSSARVERFRCHGDNKHVTPSLLHHGVGV